MYVYVCVWLREEAVDSQLLYLCVISFYSHAYIIIIIPAFYTFFVLVNNFSRISQSQHDGRIDKSPKKKKAIDEERGREIQKEKDIEHVFAGI